MPKRRPVIALFALLAIVAAAAGCGGGGSSSSSTSSSGSTGGSTTGSEAGGEAPTKAAFIKEADKVCGEAEEELNEEINEFAKENDIAIGKEEPSEAQQAELFHAVVLPNVGRQAEEIAALTPPEGDESTIEDLIETLEEEVAEAEGESGLPDDSTLKGATDKAKAYGLKTCGS